MAKTGLSAILILIYEYVNTYNTVFGMGIFYKYALVLSVQNVLFKLLFCI